MASYHQMGFNSNNLVDLPEMSRYRGAIFSPINAAQDAMVEHVAEVLDKRGTDFDIVFDPQLYVPATERGKLKEWNYYPVDVDTADLGSMRWWSSVNGKLAQAAGALNANAVCSPVVIPKSFTDAFFAKSVEIADDLGGKVKNRNVRIIQTVLVNAPELSDSRRVFEIASIVSKTKCSQIYLIFVTNIEPRRELNAPDELSGAMQLVKVLEAAHLRVLVGFCSSDVLLWKAAGASDCASGKFFNLRRFTRERFEEPTAAGGGQLPYWFEEALLAFLREQDLLLARKNNLLSEASLGNPFGPQILKLLDAAKSGDKKTPWLGVSWRQFLYWFADVQERIEKGTSVDSLLSVADANWAKLERARVLFVERPNDGSWVRSWRNALNLFNSQ